MAAQRVDKLISSIISDRVDNEIEALMNTITNLIENGDIVPDDDREDAAMRIIFHLENEEKEWRSQGQIDQRLAPTYRTLKMMVNNKNDKDMKYLKAYLRTKIKETKEGKNDEEFHLWISECREKFLPESDEAHEEEIIEPPSWAIATMGSALNWVYIQAMENIRAFQLPVGSTIDEAVAFLTNGGIASTVAVSAAYVGCVTIYNLMLVAFGKRSWSRAAKNIVDDGGSLVVGNLVGLGVAAGVGTLCAMPAWGYFLLSAGVSWLMSWIGWKCISEWTSKWFNIPRDERLEDAYNFLGVNQTDTNSVVNRAYRLKSREFHPDTLGKWETVPDEMEVGEAVQTFIKIQNAFEVIREAREKDGCVVGQGENQRDEEEISWGKKVTLLIKKLNPFRHFEDGKPIDLLPITYEFPPVVIFDESSVDTVIEEVEPTE